MTRMATVLARAAEFRREFVPEAAARKESPNGAVVKNATDPQVLHLQGVVDPGYHTGS